MKIKKELVISVLVLFMLSLTMLFQTTEVQAQDTREVAVPVTITPHGTIVDKTPTYKWTKITGATMYQYQVWSGSTKVLDKSPDSGVCGATTCQKSPAFTLGFNAYKWRVRAYKSGAWSAWSPYMNFIVSPPSFNSPFETGMNGWAGKAGGTWSLGCGSIYTEGLPGQWSSVYRSIGKFSDFDYSASVLRHGNDTTYLAVRMGSLIKAGNTFWYPGYIFGYTNYGNYAVYRINNDGSLYTIQTWTSTTTVNKDLWNTLRVKAVGNKFWYYINGTLVKSFTDGTYSRGYIGATAYRSPGSTLASYLVDWATLTVIKTPQ